MKRTMGLNILLSNLTAPIFAILNASGESILEILHEGAKQKRKTNESKRITKIKRNAKHGTQIIIIIIIIKERKGKWMEAKKNKRSERTESNAKQLKTK